VDAPNRVVLDANTGLADATVVTLVKLDQLRSYTAEQIGASGDHVLLRPERPNQVNNGDLLRIRLAAAVGGGQFRQLTSAPVVTVDVSEALGGATLAGLDVLRLAEDPPQLSSVAVVSVRTRLVFLAPFVLTVGDQLLIGDAAEMTIATITNIDGQTVIIDDHQEFVTAATVTVDRLAATGITSSGATLGEGLVMVPADPNEEPTTRRRALENHEMRHVFQESLWGPFFISMPIPWLFHLGYGLFSDNSASASKLIRHFGLGGLDSAIAALVWGIGGADSPIRLKGVLQNDRRTVNFPADVDAEKLARFEKDNRIDLAGSQGEDFNVVDSLDTGARRVVMRFPASAGRFTAGGEVTLVMSPFEQVRKTVNTYFSLNLEQLWADHIPTGWGRALSSLLNRDSWFPLLGLYPLGFMFSGGDDRRSPFEQDAAFHSGDLYTDIPLSDPTEVFVGQFSRVYAFIQAREGGVAQSWRPTRLMTIELPVGAAADAVMGSEPFGGNQVRLRENWMLPLHPRVENAVAGLFAASVAGDYPINVPNPLDEDVVLAGAMPTAFTERDHIQVRDLVIEPLLSREVFETEVVNYQVTSGDSSANYALRFPFGVAPGGQVNGLRFTAPLVTVSPTITQGLEITASYAAAHPVFSGAGQSGAARLRADQRTNIATRFILTIRELSIPVVGPVDAGTETAFELPISPREIRVTSPLPAGAGTNARVVDAGERPAQMTFFAPDAVTSASNVVVEFSFGAYPGANPSAAQRTLTLTVQVRPAPP